MDNHGPVGNPNPDLPQRRQDGQLPEAEPNGDQTIPTSEALDPDLIEEALNRMKLLNPKMKPIPCPKCGKKFYYMWTGDGRVHEIYEKLMGDLDCELSDEEEALLEIMTDGYMHKCEP